MRHLIHGIACFALVGCAIGVLVFETLVVLPLVTGIVGRLDAATPSERQPPTIVTDMLRRAYSGSQIKSFVVRNAMSAFPPVRPTMRRQFTELGVFLLLPLHLSESEIESAYISSVYMGNDVHGFAKAAQNHLGVPLESVNVNQAARLVAIAHAPSAYLQDAERLERRTQYLLSLPPRQ
jgi:hypothetical protein